jgi:hypothetical protein
MVRLENLPNLMKSQPFFVIFLIYQAGNCNEIKYFRKHQPGGPPWLMRHEPFREGI